MDTSKISFSWHVVMYQKFKKWAFNNQYRILFPYLFFASLNWLRKDKKEHPEFYRPHGIFVFHGLYGSGKSLSMVRHCLQLMKENPGIKVYANFDTPFSERLKSIKQMLDVYHDKGTIFMIDEAQLSFNTRDYQNFPWQMVSALTQNRKEAKCFLFAAQNFDHVEKHIRDLCYMIIECRSLAKIYFVNRWFTPRDFEKRFVVFERRPGPLKKTRFFIYPELLSYFSSLEKLSRLTLVDSEDSSIIEAGRARAQPAP